MGSIPDELLCGITSNLMIDPITTPARALRPEDVAHDTCTIVGRGGSGIVHRGRLTWPDGRVQDVAIKRLQMGATQGDERRFERELQVSVRATERCARACQLYGCVVHEGALCLVMKLYAGSLHAFLDKRRSPDGSTCVQPLEHARVVALSVQILEGLVQLHAEGIVAQDLKPSNLLMDEHEQLVIADFGLATVLNATTVSAQQSTTGAGGGTPAYKAPEQYDADSFGKVSPKTDMWAFGCVVVELLTGFPPWRGKQPLEIMMSVAAKRQVPSVPSEARGALAELLRGCLLHDQSARPTAQQALTSLRPEEGVPGPAPPPAAAVPLVHGAVVGQQHMAVTTLDHEAVAAAAAECARKAVANLQQPTRMKLRKPDGSHLGRRLFRLRDSRLLIASSGCCSAPGASGSHDVNGVQDGSLASNPLGFTVLTKREPVIIVAETVEARQLWMAALQATADHVQAAERLREIRDADERRLRQERQAEERRLAAEAEKRRRAAELPLRAELQQLSVLELRARARRDGCTKAAIENTKLSEQPKVALIGLVVARHWAVTAAEAAISDARQAWAQKLERHSPVLTGRYRKMEMRALVPFIKANPLVDDAAIEAALREETPKPRLVQLLVEAAPATLLAEASTAAAVDAELPVGTRMKIPGQAGVGTYLSFKRARLGGANEHTVAFSGEQAPARVEVISLKEFISGWWVDGDKIAPYLPLRWARAHAELGIHGEGGALAKMNGRGGKYLTALCGEAMEVEGEHYAEFTLVSTKMCCVMVGVARPTFPTHNPVWDDGKAVAVHYTADGWMLGCYNGSHYHASHSGKAWASGSPPKMAQGETVGLLLSRGRLTVYRNGLAVGVLCEGLSGSLVWAVDIRDRDVVRITRRPVPAAHYSSQCPR